MKKIIEYFIDHKNLNYIVLIFILYSGIIAYQETPREIFPEMELEKISIKGAYPGTSADNMDKLIVRDLENSLTGLVGIDKMESVITPGKFSIILTLKENSNKIVLLSNVKDSISINKKYLPADMNDPIATLVDRVMPVINISISSETLKKKDIIDISKELEQKISHLKHVAKVSIKGDSEKELSIKLDSKAIMAFNLDPREVVRAISNLSYTFPIGDIEEKGNFVFISTSNGKFSIKDWENTVIKINRKYIKLREISRIEEIYPQEETISSFNNIQNIGLSISKGSSDDSIDLSKQIREYIENIKSDYPEVTFNFYKDTSKKIENRLEVVMSNLLFGLILVFFSMFILINLRIAIVVSIGIPFSFIIGMILIYTLGYSINIISLLGALIVIGIVVDDAIVIAENIQRHIDEGMDNKTAAIEGTLEMVLPITLATITTVVAFLPVFILTGEIGLFIILIPIMTISILLGSLIESFLFLPLHSEELLKKSKNKVDWTKIQNIYEQVLHYLIKSKRTFLVGFLIVVPIMTGLTLKSMNFQFFAPFDGENVYVSGKFNINTPIEDTHKKALELEKIFMEKSEEFSIKSTSVITGYRKNLAGEKENGNNIFFLTIELKKQVDNNPFDKYINPILTFSFEFNDPEKVRTIKSAEIADKVRDMLKNLENFNFEEIEVKEDKAGIIKSDIKLNLIGKNQDLIDKYIEEITSSLKMNPAVTTVGHNVHFGKSEYKLEINKLGESLGVTETSLGTTLNGYFLDHKQATTFDKTGIMEIKTLDIEKDKVSTLMNFQIPVEGERFVTLADIVNIKIINDYEKIEKLNGIKIKSVFANVNTLKTAGQVLEDIEEIIKRAENDNIKILFAGEKEKKDQLKKDMKKAGIIAIFLIVISLLLIFRKLKYVLMIISVIPMSLLGALVGHKLLGLHLTMPSLIGILGLAGVVVNDAIIMLDFLHGTHDAKDFFKKAKLRLRPILITSITTFLGMFTFIFYASGETVILQPIAVSIGFGLLWGTILNLFYIPTLYAVINKIEDESLKNIMRETKNV